MHQLKTTLYNALFLRAENGLLVIDIVTLITRPSYGTTTVMICLDL